MNKLVCALVLAGLTLLVGCAQDPHVAARVDGQTISVSDVDILSKALCIEHTSAAQSAATTMSQIRGSALAALIDTKVDAAIAQQRALSYDPRQLGNAMQQLETLVDRLPADEQDRARELITDLLKGQLQLSNAAMEQIRLAGKQATQQLVTQTVQQIESERARTMKISVNPEFTSPGLGNTKDGSTSVSLGVSATARDARTAFTGVPSATYVAGLPTAQKCG